jgi:hypothetical protein
MISDEETGLDPLWEVGSEANLPAFQFWRKAVYVPHTGRSEQARCRWGA